MISNSNNNAEDDDADGDDGDDDDDDDSNFDSKRKSSEEWRLNRCRERNRKHARNTRERKKLQLDSLQLKIQELTEEKIRLMNLSNEQSVASILISLTDKQATADSHPSIDYQNGDMKDALYISYNASSHELANKTIQSLRSHIASILSDDEELEGSHALLNIDKTQCTSSELEIIRRERNRMHAKKTRLRKKKMLQEMEAIVCKLQNEIRLLVESRVAQISSYSGSGSIVKKESPTITAALENVTSLFESNKKQRTSSDLMASTYTSSAITHTNQPQQIFDNSAPAEVSQVILNGLLSLGNSSVSLHEQHAYSSSSDEASSFKSPLELSRERSRY